MTDSPQDMGDEPWDVIDPTVFIDDDGQAYLYWGNTHLYYVKLKDNLVEIDGDIHRLYIQNMPGTFTEGPWEYQGKILDRIQNSGTSHPAVLEYGEESYFIYHRW